MKPEYAPFRVQLESISTAWHLQYKSDSPRSSKPERDDLAIEALHDGTRVLHDPMTFLGT